MIKDINFTEFAPAEKDTLEVIFNTFYKFKSIEKVEKIVNAIPDILLILNSKRQIVFFNNEFLEFYNIYDIKEILGKRPCDAFSCIHSFENPGGCGTTIFCSQCGAVKAILDSLKGQESVYECRITSLDNVFYDLRVWSSPYVIDNEVFSIFVIQDISNEKRRQVLERVFFHDIMNTVGSLVGITDLLKKEPEEIKEFNELIYLISHSLIDEINAQKQLLSAENGNLVLSLSSFSSFDIIDKIISIYKKNPVAEDKQIILDKKSIKALLESDFTILSRVLGNLLKNALEASTKGENIVISTFPIANSVVFNIQNPKVIPQEIQLQIFQRSFSTKGNGRGIGTYSVKLFTENYLKGKVSFVSNKEQGTIFTLKLSSKYLLNEIHK